MSHFRQKKKKNRVQGKKKGIEILGEHPENK